MAPSFAITIH